MRWTADLHGDSTGILSRSRNSIYTLKEDAMTIKISEAPGKFEASGVDKLLTQL
jgi:hypothetical protein